METERPVESKKELGAVANRKDLARTILAMNYGELKAVCSGLAGACEDKEARPRMKTTEDFADLLFDWAEAEGA